MKNIRCMHISDTHQQNIADIVITDLKEKKIENVDMLFITGDLTYRGDIDKLKRCAEQCEDLITYRYVTDIVIIPGNHDKTFEKAKMSENGKASNWETPVRAKACFANKKGIHLLIHETKEIQGIKIFGSPWTPYFNNWAFNYHPLRGTDLWMGIPLDTEVLLTHGPPEYILDEVHDYMTVRNCGCSILKYRIKNIPSITHHLFGHIHEGYGMKIIDGVTYMNSSIMDGRYKPTNKPQYFNIKKD